jgi:hypothetical protein
MNKLLNRLFQSVIISCIILLSVSAVNANGPPLTEVYIYTTALMSQKIQEISGTFITIVSTTATSQFLSGLTVWVYLFSGSLHTM